MEVSQKIVVIVEDIEVARTALRWALRNVLRYGDLITLLHVYPISRSRSKKKLRLLRLNGFQLALSFQTICINDFPNTKTEIVVTEGDEDGEKICELVRRIGASTLVVGLHDQSFLYRGVLAVFLQLVPVQCDPPPSTFNVPTSRLAMAHQDIVNNFNCKVLAIKQPRPLTTRPNLLPQSSTNMDFSQIEIAALSVPDVPQAKIPYQICPDPSAIIWRCRRRRRRYVNS